MTVLSLAVGQTEISKKDEKEIVIGESIFA